MVTREAWLAAAAVAVLAVAVFVLGYHLGYGDGIQRIIVQGN